MNFHKKLHTSSRKFLVREQQQNSARFYHREIDLYRNCHSCLVHLILRANSCINLEPLIEHGRSDPSGIFPVKRILLDYEFNLSMRRWQLRR